MFDSEIKGLIFNIQKFSIHDGHGIRTLVFMKGCPLKCLWCSNPESQSFSEEIMYLRKNCTNCRKCIEACPIKIIDSNTLEADPESCTACGNCTKVCYANARKKVGTIVTVYDVIKEIEKDRVFFRNSNGGITIGGGEPTSQPEFVEALLRECKRLNLHTAIETCGYGKWDRIKGIFNYTDQVFYDLKHMDADIHKALTSVSNESILENASKIAALGKEVIFRIPLIPGCNDDQDNIIETGNFVRALMTPINDIKIEILPYHGLGSDKYTWLNQEYTLKDVKPPDAEKVGEYKDILKQIGCNVVE